MWDVVRTRFPWGGDPGCGAAAEALTFPDAARLPSAAAHLIRPHPGRHWGRCLFASDTLAGGARVRTWSDLQLPMPPSAHLLLRVLIISLA